jgi:hypothetical protein
MRNIIYLSTLNEDCIQQTHIIVVHILNLVFVLQSMADSEIFYTTVIAMQTLSEHFELMSEMHLRY